MVYNSKFTKWLFSEILRYMHFCIKDICLEHHLYFTFLFHLFLMENGTYMISYLLIYLCNMSIYVCTSNRLVTIWFSSNRFITRLTEDFGEGICSNMFSLYRNSPHGMKCEYVINISWFQSSLVVLLYSKCIFSQCY
jgi:hypothetical protein